MSLHGNPICPDGLNLQPFSSYLPYDYNYYRLKKHNNNNIVLKSYEHLTYFSNFIVQSLDKLKFLDHGLVQRSYTYESFPNGDFDRDEIRFPTKLWNRV